MIGAQLHAMACGAWVALSATASPATTSPWVTPSNVEFPFVRLALGLLLCSLLALLAAIALKRFMRAGKLPAWSRLIASAPEKRVAIMETRRLSAHADICRFRYDDTEYLVVVSPGGATVVREGPAAASPPAEGDA